jgi:hypothetical protein
VFNVISFAAPFERNAGFWICYAFSTFAVLLADALTFHALGREGARSRFYGLPLVYVSWLYLGLQLALSFGFMSAPGLRRLTESMPQIPVWLILVVNVLSLGLCLIGLITIEMGNTEIRRLERTTQENIFPVKLLRMKLEDLAAGTGDPALKKALSALAEGARFSDPVSASGFACIEDAIAAKTSLLGERVAAGNTEEAKDLCAELQRLLDDRNRQCMLLKM